MDIVTYALLLSKLKESGDVGAEQVQGLIDTALQKHTIDVTAHNDIREEIKKCVKEETIQNKLDKQQGVENAGKILVVGEDGNVIPNEVTSENTNTEQITNPSTTYTLQPNIQVVWGEVVELNLTLAPEKPNAINIYPFWFTSGATPTKVTLPIGIILDGFVTKPNKKYCCQIEQNVLFWKEFEVVA